MTDCSRIEEVISQSTDQKFKIQKSLSLSGGSISQSQCITGKDGRVFFSKENELAFLPFFEAEAVALEQIRKTRTIRTPEVIGFGSTEVASFLVLEFIEEGSSSSSGQQEMGTQLARLHKIEQPFFGWVRDNCIGSTPQPNPKSDNWVQFYQQYRLQHQLQLAAGKGRSFEKAEALLLNLEFFFEDYTPHPSLLHGDLWGGNASQDRLGSPFIFDPASYYGDREADIAFTYMFGGFSSSFYEAYENEFPLHPGFKTRKILYNLYHELNHFNLFGGGYASSAQSSINQLMSLL
jgi:fructosamine-3-kinase